MAVADAVAGRLEDLRGTALRTSGLAGLVLVVAALGVEAVRSPKVALLGVLGLVLLAVVLRSLTTGIVVFTFSIFFFQLPGLTGSGFTPVKGLGVLLALCWAVTALDRSQPRRLLLGDRPLFSLAAAGLVVWSVCSAAWAADGGLAISQAFRLLQSVVLVFVVYTAVTRTEHLRQVAWAFVLGNVLTTLAGIVVGSSALAPAKEGRLTGAVDDPNFLAASLVLALAIAVFLLPTTRGGARAVLVASAGVCLAGIWLTQSRGGLIAVVVMVLGTIVAGGRLRGRATVGALAVAAFAVPWFAFVEPPSKAGRIFQLGAGGGTGRTDLWAVALRVFRDHPLVGVGSNNFPVVEAKYVLGGLNLPRFDLVLKGLPTHNLYLQILAELGAVGFLLFAAVVGAALVAGVRGYRAAAAAGDLELELLGRALVIGFLGLMTAYIFLSAEVEKQLWLMVGLLVGLPATAVRARRAAVVVPGEDYDLAVAEAVVQQLEERLLARIDALVAEQDRLRRRETLLNRREAELRESLRTAPGPTVQADPELERELAQARVRIGELEQEIARAAETARRESADSIQAARAAAERASVLDREAVLLRSAVEEAEAAAVASARRTEQLEAELARARAEPVVQANPELEGAVASAQARIAELEQELARATEAVRRQSADSTEAVQAAAERASALEREAAELRRAVAEAESVAAANAGRAEQLEAELTRLRTAATAPAPAPSIEVPAPAVQAAPEQAPAFGAAELRLNLHELERLIDEAGDVPEDEAVAWGAYLANLRPYADRDGWLPASFDALAEGVFGDLAVRARRPRG
jgi:O-antigen ligase